MARKGLLATLLLVIAIGGVWAWQGQRTTAATVDASLIPLLMDEKTAGFARATQPGAIRFPDDLGAHEEYQTEWWYYTGNLETVDGRLFGFQFTIFRRALMPPRGALTPPDPLREADSQWRSEQVYLAHFALSDIGAEQFYHDERFSRGGAGLAGATAVPYRVWLEDWFVEEIAPGQTRLFARADEFALDLTLTETMEPILHGDRGLSQKGPEPGNASYYYSIIRQQAVGQATTRQGTFEVTGLAWKDHEYSTSALSAGAIGWDWFSLQLDDGSGLMLFEIRRADGSLESFSAGSYIFPDGTVQHLSLGDWQLEVLSTWTSPQTGAAYPNNWRLTIPALNLELTGQPLMANQELTVSTTYWEGAVSFSGTLGGQPITARGYVEMTGYAETMEGRL
jgi:predicted secreted hydrolase